MTRISLIASAHQSIRQCLKPGDIAIDATLGNGHDTLFLAECVGEQGRVYGFDVQSQALAATGARLAAQGRLGCVSLIQASHAEMRQYVPVAHHGRVAVIMFNLGYLPGADKQVITQTQTTLIAVAQACALLRTHGLLTIMAYPGHVGGDEETQAVALHCQALHESGWQLETLFSHIDQATAPRLFALRKPG